MALDVPLSVTDILEDLEFAAEAGSQYDYELGTIPTSGQTYIRVTQYDDETGEESGRYRMFLTFEREVKE